MATEVAESSVTFEGDNVNFVIDSGLSNQSKYYPNSSIDALECKYIAQANHIQREGRTGRKEPGTSYKLFTEKEYKNMVKHPNPEIFDMDLKETILDFMCLPYITHVNLPFTYSKGKENKEEEESLNSFISKFIEPPPIDNVKSGILKLIQIGAIEKKGSKGILTEFGKAVNSFIMKGVNIEQAASVIESHNYRCSNEVIGIVSLLAEIDHKIDNIFESKPRPKNNKNSEYKEKLNKYKNAMKKLANSSGEFVILHKILQTFKEKQYNIRFEKGREYLNAKGTGEGSSWAKKNFINSSKLKNVFKNDTYRRINMNLGRCIGNYRKQIRNKNPNANVGRVIFMDKEPEFPDKFEDRIIKSFLRGYIGNIAKMVSKDKYKSCFPEEKLEFAIDRFSIMNYVNKKPTVVIYNILSNINGRRKISGITKVPPKMIQSLSTDKQKAIKNCT